MTPESIIEAVAVAIAKAQGKELGDISKPHHPKSFMGETVSLAQAAIEATLLAVREPENGVIRAVDAALHENWPSARKMAVAMNHAMIDAVLAQLKGRPEPTRDKQVVAQAEGGGA